MKITRRPTMPISQDANGARPSPSPTLASIPGITINSARHETAPRGCPIRYDAKPPRVATGAAALALNDRRLDAIAGAIIAARSGIANEVTL